VFAERGIDAPLDEIAHRAEIGNATLYRHFPDRCQLIAAVFTDELARYADLVQKALRAEDPGAALREYVQASCALQAGNRGLADLLTSTVLSDPHLDALRRRARRDLGRLIRRAQQA
jgi:AcrR family transcriptional regulator